MAFTKLSFGKYRGKTLAQVLFHDPDWFFWCYTNNKFRDGVKTQADYLVKRAENIKIPKDNPDLWKVEYLTEYNSGKLAVVSIVDADKPPHQGSSGAYYKRVIDMSLPYNLANYDKLGYKIMIKFIKSAYFGDSSYKMTAKRCEEFFANSDNFVLWKKLLLEKAGVFMFYCFKSQDIEN